MGDYTALILACESGDKELVKLYLEQGADPGTCTIRKRKNCFTKLLEHFCKCCRVVSKTENKSNKENSETIFR